MNGFFLTTASFERLPEEAKSAVLTELGLSGAAFVGDESEPLVSGSNESLARLNERQARRLVQKPLSEISRKLLEAAALGMPVVATPRVTAGVVGSPPAVTAKRPAAFAEALVRLWADRGEQQRLGRAARAWVTEHHTWAACAKTAVNRLGVRKEPA